MNSPVRALVPIKPLSLSKLRLAELLTPAERAQLTLAMLDDVVGNLSASEAIGDIVVVTRDPDVTDFARARGVGLIAEPEWRSRTETSLSDSLSYAVGQMQATDRALLVVPGDVPVVTAAEYDAVIQAWEGGVLAVTAQDGGTNALLSRLGDGMTYHFGPDSIAAHRDAASHKRLKFAVTSTPNWTRDVDVPADIVWLAEQPERYASVHFAKQTLRCKAQLRRSA